MPPRRRSSTTPSNGDRAPRFAPRLPESLDPADVVLEDDAQWSEARISGDFSGAVASHAEITECRVVAARFVGVELEQLRLADVVFEDCDLSGAVLSELSAVRVEFRGCRMAGLVAPAAGMRDVAFIDCRLDDANFRMTTWERAEITGCRLVEADFYAARLGGAPLTRCDLTGVHFDRADLAGVRLHGSTIERVAGGDALREVVIASDQIVPLALAVFGSLGIRIDDEATEAQAGPPQSPR